MYYSMIAISALLFSMQFMFNDGFVKENGNGLSTALKFSFYTSIVGVILLFFINSFHFDVSWFSIAIAMVYSLVCIVLSYCSVKAFSYANLAVYSVFSMIGGMILPFIYGAVMGEEITFMRVLCCFLICLAVIITVQDGKTNKKAFKFYIGVFVLNGMVGVISSFHQSKETLCTDSSSFLALTKIITLLICSVLILIKRNSFKISKKSLLLSVGNAGFNSIGNLMLLIALLHIPASVQYPIVTGGTIVFACIIDKMRKVKVTNKELIAAILALVASVFMAF